MDFFAGVCFCPNYIYVYAAVEAIYFGDGSMEGYTVNRLVWYYIAAEMVILSKSDVFHSMNEEIKSGNIAYKLNKPYSFVLYQLSEGMGQISVRLIMNLPVGLLLGYLYVGKLEGFDPVALPVVIISTILGILLNFFMDAFIGMTSWTEDNSAFYWIVQKLSFMLGLFCRWNSCRQ